MGVASGYAVQEVADKHQTLLSIPLPQNKELDWLEFIAVSKAAVADKYTDWNDLSTALKCYMIFGSLLMTTAGKCLAKRAAQELKELDAHLAKPAVKDQWDKDMEEKVLEIEDKLEREHPDDFELYLRQSGQLETFEEKAEEEIALKLAEMETDDEAAKE